MRKIQQLGCGTPIGRVLEKPEARVRITVLSAHEPDRRGDAHAGRPRESRHRVRGVLEVRQPRSFRAVVRLLQTSQPLARNAVAMLVLHVGNSSRERSVSGGRLRVTVGLKPSDARPDP